MPKLSLEETIAVCRTASGATARAGRATAVWEQIRGGWDPERIEWQRWLRRWWPVVLVIVLAVSLGISFLPHGSHTPASPPRLELFGENTGHPAPGGP